MDFSYIFHSSIPNYEKFADFGFAKNGDEYICKKPLSEPGFYAIFKVHGENLTAQVYETLSETSFETSTTTITDEKYTLLDVKTATGPFVTKIRQEVQQIIDDFRELCFESDDVHEKYLAFLKSEFSCKPDFPWEGFSDYAVFRCPNKKWFALVMKISYKNVGLKSEEPVYVVNLKADSDKISQIIDKKSIFPAYHMNKKHWITILLTKVTDYEKLCALTKRSYDLVK